MGLIRSGCRKLLPVVLAFVLGIPSQAETTFPEISPSEEYQQPSSDIFGGHPSLPAGLPPESRLAFHPESMTLAQAGNSSMDLEDLGFSKSDTKQDASYQKLLDRRTKMLKIHQILGLATGVVMALALSEASGTNTKGPDGQAQREDHEKLGIATGVLYFTTASFSIFAPEVPNQKTSGRTKIHRGLAFIHFPAMLATMYLGITDKKKLDNGEDPSGLKPAVATVGAVAFYASLAIMVIPFGGEK